MAIATWAAARRDALHGAADLEQGHRVGVRAGAQLDVARGSRHAAPPSVSGGRGRDGRPASSPAPDVCADAPGRGRGRLVGGAERGEDAANSGSTSPCRAQSSRVAESSVVRSSVLADRVGHLVVEPAGGDWTASQPQSTSSPSGVSPSPRPTIRPSTSGVDVRRESEGGEPVAAGRGGRASAIAGLAARPRTLPRSIRGTRTSTNRPTGRGWPARCRVPRTT